MTIDAALANDFEDLTALLHIKRDRSKSRVKNWVAPGGDLSQPGSDLFMRAIAKIAVNYYLMKVRGQQNLQPIINFIKGAEVNHYHVQYGPIPQGLWKDREVYHLIAIKSNATLEQLYAHVILFNSYSFIVNLCPGYDGDEVDLFYRYDVLQEQEIKERICLDYVPAGFFE